MEYAPVPPDGRPSHEGNLNSLGLGSGRGLFGTTGPPIESESGAGLPGQGLRPSNKRCVGNPPRQTEDPLAPPCVAFFEGNNGGATHAGISANEVRILIYYGYSYEDTDYGEYEEYACGTFTDLAAPHQGWSFPYLRAYQRYFNDRYQTYDRFVHFWVHSASCDSSPEARRADALLGISKIKPFAVYLDRVEQNSEPYMETIASRGVSAFVNPSLMPNMPRSRFSSNPGLAWSYPPTLEHQADLYSSFVCSKVVPHPVSFSGSALDNDDPRKLGQLFADDPDVPEFRQLSKRIRTSVEQCGGRIAVERTVPWANTVEETQDDAVSPSEAAASNMATFKTEDVTTILWTGMADITHSRAAAALDYRPEWIVLGAMNMDINAAATLQDSSVWQHAWVITQATYQGPMSSEQCYLAAKEADPTVAVEEATIECFETYPFFRQIFTGVQVAGPRLTPRSLDQGFHAIPPVPSSNPSIPACYYDPGDYSCVKDVVAEWWDPTRATSSEGGQPGCYRMPERGRRFLLGTWPKENVDDRKKPDDICNNRGSGVL